MVNNDADRQHQDDQEAARELLECFGEMVSHFANFALAHVDDMSRAKLKRYMARPDFRLAVAIEMAPAMRVRLVASCAELEPFALFELKPAPAPN